MFATVDTNVPRALSDNPSSGLPFEDVLSQVAARHDLVLPDKVVPLSTLRVTHNGHIAVPGLGNLALTPWARRSLARLLGIRWDRWFSSDTIAPADRAVAGDHGYAMAGARAEEDELGLAVAHGLSAWLHASGLGLQVDIVRGPQCLLPDICP